MPMVEVNGVRNDLPQSLINQLIAQGQRVVTAPEGGSGSQQVAWRAGDSGASGGSGAQNIYNPNGPADNRPQMPSARDLLDPNGNLKSQYLISALPDIAFESTMPEFQNRMDQIELNKEGINALRKRATSTGPSEWQNLMLQKQGLEEQNALGNAARQGASASSYAFSEGARQGGLSSGARERLAAQSARGLSGARQDVLRGGMGQRLDIATEDERQRLDLLKALPGLENTANQGDFEKLRMYGTLADSEANRKQNLGLSNRTYQSEVQRQNILNTLGEVARQDKSKLSEYEEKMKSYAAEKQAEATAKSGKK